MTGLRRREDRISEGCEAIDSRGCQAAGFPFDHYFTPRQNVS